MLDRALRKLPPVLKKPPPATVCFATTLATTSGRFDLFRTRRNTDDSFKWKRGVDNKRHTNAHRHLTSPSPIGALIPPSPPDSYQHWS